MSFISGSVVSEKSLGRLSDDGSKIFFYVARIARSLASARY